MNKERRVIFMKYSIDTHTHTLVSGHAYNTIDEMAAYAAGIGVTHLAITDHAPKMPGSAGILYFSNMGIIPRQKCGVKIYMGCEANIMDYERLVKAAKQKHVLLELNNTSLNPTGPRQGTYENDVHMLNLCKEIGVSISIGSDAHIKESICDFDRAYKVIEETAFPDELIVNSDYRLYESFIGRRDR